MENFVVALYLDGDSGLYYKNYKIKPINSGSYNYVFEIESPNDLCVLRDLFYNHSLELREDVWECLSYIFYDFIQEALENINTPIIYENGNYCLEYYKPCINSVKDLK